jgi:acyl-coenzyme A thioesterase PaaI-like protein
LGGSYKLKTAGVTSALHVKYLKPVYVVKGELKVLARVISTNEKLAEINCELFDGTGAKCAEAVATYFCFPEKIAKAKYHYPGIEAFYE